MRFHKILLLFFVLYTGQVEASSSEIVDPETPRTFASNALNTILATLSQRIVIDSNNLKNIKELSQQRSAEEKTAKLFEYLEIAELKGLGESLLNRSLTLVDINQANYESKRSQLINQTADSCSKIITGKIKGYVTLAVKLRKAQQDSNQEAIETLIKEMYVSYLNECKTMPNTTIPPYFSIAWDRVFSMTPPFRIPLIF